MSTSIRPRADVSEFLFAAPLVSWRRPFPTASCHMMASHGLIFHLVVSLWSVPECAPAVSMVEQQCVPLAIARVPFHSCKHALHTMVGLQRVMDVSKHVSAIHVFLVVLSCRSCQSSFDAYTFSSVVSHLRPFGCSPHQNSSAPHRIAPRTLLDRHQPTPSQRGRLFRAFQSSVRREAAICIVASRTGDHQVQACPVPDPPRGRHLCHDRVCLASTVQPVHRVCGNTMCSLFQHGLCRVPKLGSALRCVHQPPNSYACHTDARRCSSLTRSRMCVLVNRCDSVVVLICDSSWVAGSCCGCS